MAGTDWEYLSYACGEPLPPDFPAGLRWLDGMPITTREADDIRALIAYRGNQLQRRWWKARRRNAQRRALCLLRRYLSPSQAESLRRRGEFLATMPSGATYRLDASRGRTERVVRHGRRWFVRVRFCLHETDDTPDDAMPPADMSLAHLLLLHADEGEFLRLANATPASDMLWNGDWLRRLRAARLERSATA